VKQNALSDTAVFPFNDAVELIEKETAEEVDEFLDKLPKEILTAIKNDKRVKILYMNSGCIPRQNRTQRREPAFFVLDKQQACCHYINHTNQTYCMYQMEE